MKRLVCSAAIVVSVCLAPASRAEIIGYEWVFQSGQNNVLDSNTGACSSTVGCYDRTLTPCRDYVSAGEPQICDLLVVPAGHCTYGTTACVWPHQAGHCEDYPDIGCLSDDYADDPYDQTDSGPSRLCGGATCLMDVDPFGQPFNYDCFCGPSTLRGGDDAARELAVCGSPGGVCSDGDPDRDVGGYGLALGLEIYVGTPSTGPVAAGLGPTVNGTPYASTSPRYPIENPPTLVSPQRDPGTILRTVADPGANHLAKTREAFDLTTLNAALGVEKLRGIGKSFWADWTTDPGTVSQTILTTHQVPFACDPPAGWTTDAKIDPTPGAPNSGDEAYCSQLARDSVTILWRRDLTPAERADNRTCPPTCRKDFDLTTTEDEALLGASIQNANAGLQLGIQSGEGRFAGANDSISATPVTLMLWINGVGAGGSDLRCHLGGWGNAPGMVGRCSDGPLACRPGDPVEGDALCAAASPSQGTCRACNGPIDYTNASTSNGLPNALGLPPGYDNQGLSVLGLDKSERIGGIAGVAAVTRIPLFLIGTSGYAASDFRDTPGTLGSPDIADMGEVDPSGAPFAIGVGAGGAFLDGSTLPIGSPCCGGSDVIWQPAAVGSPLHTFLRTFDSTPGPDGIPGCIGDNVAYDGTLLSVGTNACNQRLGRGPVGPKTDGFYATGKDDQPILYDVGASGPIPASSARFPARWPLNGTCPLTSGAHPVFNEVNALAYRDANVIFPASTDILMKLNVTYCPAVGANGHDCTVTPPSDQDCDGVLDASDNCPTVSNASQADGDVDGVGDACDNCTNLANPRVAGDFIFSNPWATLTGSQRDDDHDGYGNKCDAKFPGVAGAIVGAGDLTQFRASNGKSRTGDTCGTTHTRPCAIFDLDESSTLLGAPDLAQFRLLNGKAPGAKCTTCPMPCTAGTAGTCGAIP